MGMKPNDLGLGHIEEELEIPINQTLSLKLISLIGNHNKVGNKSLS